MFQQSGFGVSLKVLKGFVQDHRTLASPRILETHQRTCMHTFIYHLFDKNLSKTKMETNEKH